MAQVDYFLKIPGIEGESTDEGHGGEIEVQSWSWGETNSATHESGTTGGGAGRVAVQDFTFTMEANKATPVLMQYCATGKHITEEVVLTCRRAGEEQQEYFFIKMKNVYVTSYQTGGSSGDIVPIDAITLNFGAIMLEYMPQKEDGTLDAAIPGSWNVQTNTKDY
ncbi:MAG: Hcp family type VI secretion system effector [Gemmataceae bacterium]